MKKYIGGILSLLAFAAPFAADASATGGNCLPAAVKLTPSDAAQSVTLVREWDPYGGDAGTGDWMDGGDTSLQSGVKWYYVDLAKGTDYVVWIDNDDVTLDVTKDYDADSCPITDFAPYYTDANSYWYVTSAVGDNEGQWSPDDPATCRFYIGLYGEVNAKANLYFRQASIAQYAPSGSELNPITLNVTSDGSTPVRGNPGESEVYYKFSAETGFHYLFTCTSSPTNMPMISLVSLGDDTIEYSEDVLADPDGGVYRYDISVMANTTVFMKVEADTPALCNLSWMRTEVGTAGFSKATVQVSDDAGYAEVSVTRTSRNVALRYEWMTVAETAAPGVDYTPMRGELVFEPNGDLTETIQVPLVPGASPSGGTKSFAVRLLEIDEHDLEEDEYSPVPSPNVARVVITPTGGARPSPSVPPADDEDVDTLLSVGSFEGVVTTEDKTAFAVVVLSSSTDGELSATVALNGNEYVFAGTSSGTNSELTCSMSVAGETFNAYLYFTPSQGTVADLAGEPADAAWISGSLFVETQGAAEEKFFSGPLYRAESRLDTPTLGRMTLKAGRYVTALGFDWQPGVTDVAGLLAVDVEADGTATGRGRLSDGTEISFESSANDVAEGVAVPIAWGATNNLAGTLVLGDANGYDYWTSRYRLYNGWKLVVSDESSAFDGLEVMFDTDDTPVANRAVALEFDIESGILSGSEGSNTFAVALYTSAGDGDTGAAGYELDGGGVAASFVMKRAWLDLEWSEDWGVEVTVSFDADGGTGTMDQIFSSLGMKIVLPECAFTRADHRFTGWRHPSTGALLQPGEEVNAPAADSAFKAVWENVKIKEALDCDDLAFSCDNLANWDVESTASAEGGKCVRSVMGLDLNGTYTISADVETAGVISFKWGLVRRNYWKGGSKPDSFELVVDGETVLELSGADYTSPVDAQYEIEADGPHVIVWKYVRATGSNYNNLNNTVDACARLDAVAWEPVDPTRVTVTFDAGEYGTSSATSVYCHVGEAIGELPTATRPGCRFVAWVTPRGSAVTPETIVPVGGLALSARWSATVSFDGNGDVSGNVPQPIEVVPGDAITFTNAAPYISDDFEFLGWRLGEKVYAPNGGTCDTESIEAKAGSTIETLPTPTYDGGSFVGWYLGNSRVALPYTAGRSNVTMTAHWGFTVSFAAGGAGGTPPADIAAEPGDVVALPGRGNLTWDSHSFVGWSDGAKTYAEGAEYTVNSSATLTAVWQNTYYNTALDCDDLVFTCSDEANWTAVSDASAEGGSYVRSSVSGDPNGTYTISTDVETAGVIFFKWGLVRRQYQTGGTRPDTFKLIVDGETVLELSGAEYYSFVDAQYEIEEEGPHSIVWEYERVATSNYYRTLKNDAHAMLDAVVWEPVDPTRVTVMFDAGEYGVSSVTSAYCHAGSAIGEDIDPLPTAARDGCEFVAWVTASNEVVTAETTVPEGGFTLFARWSATVSFDGNGDVTGNVPQPMAVEPGETIVLPDSQLSMSNDFLFVGWRLGSKVYAPSAQSDPIMSNVTFVAEWKDNTPFITVALDANGGACDTESVEVKAGGTIETLPTPTYDGAAFVGWFCAGERVELPYAVGASNITLTAHWGVTVSFDAGGASGAVPEDIAAEPGDKVKLPGCGDLAKDGYSFAGWSDGTKTYKGGASYTVASSATLTAVWQNTYYNTALDCTNLVFVCSDEANWTAVSDSSAVGGTSVRSSVSGDVNGSYTISADVETAGFISFKWGLARRTYWTGGPKPDTFELVVDGETVLKLSGDVTSFVSAQYEISSNGHHSIVWKYERVAASGYSKLRNDGYAKLDAVVWTSAGPTLDDGPFADASEEEREKVLAWGDENGASIEDINTMEFGERGDPLNDMAAAYLLNCATNEVAAEAAKFAITEFSVAPDGTITIVPADGDEYGNGSVEVRYSEKPAGPFTAEKPAADGKLFLRIYLVR